MALDPPVRAGAVLLSPAMASLMLALLLGLQPVTTDLMLTALPALAAELHAPMAPVQRTLSATLLAFGMAQLAWGPVADRFGRRPVMLCGLAGYALASAGATLAPSIDALVLWRAAQGAAMSASVVCARAMVRDLYEPHQGASVMARALTGVGGLAVLCPALGGWLVASFGWRSAPLLMMFAGIGLCALIVWRLPETIRQRDPNATRLRPLLRQVRTILRNPGFRAWTLMLSCSYGALFFALAGGGIVLIQVLGVSAPQAGFLLSLLGCAYVCGTLLCRRWLPELGMTGSVRRAAALSLTAGLLLAGMAAAEPHSLWALMLPMALFAVGHGVHQPCSQIGAVAAFPQAAGLASALAGFALAVVAFGVGTWLGATLDGSSLRPLAGGMAAGACASALVAWTLVRRHGEPGPAPASTGRMAAKRLA